MEPFAFPELNNKDIRTARRILKNLDIEIKAIHFLHFVNQADDQVLGQSPIAGEIVDRGVEVYLAVNKPFSGGFYLLPDLTKLSLADAVETLENQGFKFVTTLVDQDQLAEPGEILAQQPIPGSLIAKDQLISFTVSGYDGKLDGSKRVLSYVRYLPPHGFFSRRFEAKVSDQKLTSYRIRQLIKPGRVFEAILLSSNKVPAELFFDGEKITRTYSF